MDEEKKAYGKDELFEKAAAVAGKTMADKASARAAENIAAIQQAAENFEPKKKGNPFKTMKKGTLYGIVAAVVVVIAIAGAGMYKWHEEPSFCSTLCHIEGTYVDNYLQEKDVPGIDKYGYRVSNTNAMMAVLHSKTEATAKPEVVCVDCHVPNMMELAHDGLSFTTGDYYMPRDERTLEGMKSWDNETGESFCANANCHAYLLGEDGELDRAKLEKATQAYEFNPHEMYHENQEMKCGTCHKGHRASVQACTGCHEHEDVSVPKGWLTWDESQELMAKEFGNSQV